MVVLEERGFVCDCEAQENGRYCLHRAVARRRYQLEVQAIRKWEADQAAFAQQRKEQQMGKDLERASTTRQQQPEGQA